MLNYSNIHGYEKIKKTKNRTNLIEFGILEEFVHIIETNMIKMDHFMIYIVCMCICRTRIVCDLKFS